MSARRPNAIDTMVAHNIRIHRMAKGLSQANLAAVLGLTLQQVQKYETGANRVATGRLVRIADILQVPITALFDGVADAPGPIAQSPLRLISHPHSLRLAQAFSKIGDPRLCLSLVELVEKAAAGRPPRRRA
jgi:transcriptional regulator with XRE-family HTH domain